MAGADDPAAEKKKWAFNVAKDIFSTRGERNGKETMICSRCGHLPPEQRGTDWQLQLAGTTKAKVHLAVYCNGLDPANNSEDDDLRHTLLVSLSESSMTSKKAMTAWNEAWVRENGGFPPKGKASKKSTPLAESGDRLFQAPILPAAAPETEDEFSIGQLAGGSGFDEDQRQKINHLIAKLVHGSDGIPSDIVEDKAFLDLMKELNYAYYCTGVPKKQWIETFGLKGVYKELKAQTMSSTPKKSGSKKRKGVPDEAEQG